MRKVGDFYRCMFQAGFYLVEAVFWFIVMLYRIIFPKSVVEETTQCAFPRIHMPHEEDEDDEEIIPMQQRFELDNDTSLVVDHVELCPEETVFVRILSFDAYSKLYKRRVYRDRFGDRYFKYNNRNLYLDDSRTQPVVAQA